MADIDAAFEAEIKRVSTMEWNSNEMCRHFYGELRKRLNPQPGAVVGELASELRELVGDYWDLAYAEGSERRDQDTENHDAQRTILRIEEIIRTLTNTDKGAV